MECHRDRRANPEFRSEIVGEIMIRPEQVKRAVCGPIVVYVDDGPGVES